MSETEFQTEFQIDEFSDLYTGLERVQAIMEGSIKVGFHQTLGITYKRVAEGFLVATLEPNIESHGGSRGIVHGGVLAGVLDDAAGYGFYTTLPKGRWCAMSSLNISFQQAVLPGDGMLKATAQVVDQQRSSALVEVEVKQKSVLKAKAMANVVVLKR